MSVWLEPFQYPFMVNAFAITALIAAPMAALSCYLVLKGWSLMGDAISHAVLPGIVLAYLASLPLALGAFAAGMFCAVAAGYLDANSRVKQDTVLGIVFAGMFGIGLVLFVAIKPDVHLDHILFGDMLGVSQRDLLETGIIALAISGMLAAKWRDLLVYSFDEQHARAIGLPVKLLHYGLLAGVSLAVVGALKAVGIILAIAFLVAPGSIAFLVTRRFSAMIAVAVCVTLLSVCVGIYASFFLDSAPAPTVVLVLSAIFIAALTANLVGRGRTAGEAS